MEADKALAKVTAPPPQPRKWSHPEDPSDLRRFLSKGAPNNYGSKGFKCQPQPCNYHPKWNNGKPNHWTKGKASHWTKKQLTPAGKIQFCLPAWQQITQDPWVLEVVKGYQLELVQTPFRISPVTLVARLQKERQSIAAEIQSLLIKGAITRAQPQMDQFTSRLL